MNGHGDVVGGVASCKNLDDYNQMKLFRKDFGSLMSPHDAFLCIRGIKTLPMRMKLHMENPDAKIAVMNFANAFHAGGGVTTGASAQEECLCRTSTLYPLLYRQTLRNTFYKHHHDLNTPKATDSLVYTEGVIICKTDEDLPKRMPQED